MSCSLEKLKAFEDAVLGEAKYVDKFDALSVATVLSDEVRVCSHVHPSVHPSIHPSVHPSIYPSVCLS